LNEENDATFRRLLLLLLLLLQERERESTKDKKERRLEKASLVVLGETTGR